MFRILLAGLRTVSLKHPRFASVYADGKMVRPEQIKARPWLMEI
jgi:hypothetical protein